MNTAGKKAVLNVWNADGNIILLELVHPEIETARLALSTEDVVSTASGSSQTYTGYPFELSLPGDDKGVPRGSIRLSNVTRLVWGLVGNLRRAPPPYLNFYRVLESDKDTVQDEWLKLDVKRVAARTLTLEAEFGHENYATEPYPAARVIPPWCPWMIHVG